ncbi:MAG: FAD-dependent thymidylate synthase, partial [Sulfurimonas sp.]|nr:FAD-dependent thymidylate synthase [Sulfurimonas sp.]
MEDMYGIKYSKPEVILMQDTGIGVAETAARTCYDSFQNSENEAIKYIENNMPNDSACDEINDIGDST